MNNTYVKTLEKQVSLLQKVAKEMNEAFMAQSNPLAIEDLETSMKAEISELKKAYDIEKANRLKALKDLEATINKLDQTEMKLKEETEARMKAEKEVSRLKGIIADLKEKLAAKPKEVIKKLTYRIKRKSIKQLTKGVEQQEQSPMNNILPEEPPVQPQKEPKRKEMNASATDTVMMQLKMDKNCADCPLFHSCEHTKNHSIQKECGLDAIKAATLKDGELVVKSRMDENYKYHYPVYRDGMYIGQVHQKSFENKGKLTNLLEQNADKTLTFQTNVKKSFDNSIFTQLVGTLTSITETEENLLSAVLEDEVDSPAPLTDDSEFDSLLNYLQSSIGDSDVEQQDTVQNEDKENDDNDIDDEGMSLANLGSLELNLNW